MQHVLNIKASLETCGFFSEETSPQTGLGSAIEVNIQNHGYIGDPIEEHKTTITLDGKMFALGELQELMNLIDVYHKALKVTEQKQINK